MLAGQNLPLSAFLAMDVGKLGIAVSMMYTGDFRILRFDVGTCRAGVNGCRK